MRVIRRVRGEGDDDKGGEGDGEGDDDKGAVRVMMIRGGEGDEEGECHLSIDGSKQPWKHPTRRLACDRENCRNLLLEHPLEMRE